MSELADNGGKVDLDTFAKYLGLPITDTLQELFDLYDTVSCQHNVSTADISELRSCLLD